MRKITILLAAALVAVVTFGQTKVVKQESLASARAKITQVIEKPDQMTEVMRLLTASNQVVFLSEVVTAVSKMPGDSADRTAKLVEIVNTVLACAHYGNALALVAEVFATVPPNSLPAVGDSLASGLMNRAADKNVTYTDAQYIEISKRVMEAVNNRVANEDNAGVRSAFAGLMLINGSNSKSTEIVTAVVESLPDAVREDAKNEWFPAALGQGDQEKTYDPILAAVDNPVNDDGAGTAGSARKPVSREGSSSDSGPLLAIRVASAQNHDTLLSDIGGSNTDPSFSADAANQIVDAVQNSTNTEIPTGNGEGGGDTTSVIEEVVEGEVIIGYQNQTTQE